MLWLYRLLFLPVALLAAPYYGWRMRRRGGYGPGFGQRFGAMPAGLPPKRSGVRRVWVQAVSVGELLAIGPLLEAWRRDGSLEIYLTTTTSTGYKLAAERYLGRGWVAALGYFPLDFWPCSARAWRVLRPDLVVLTEGERWPEHLHQAEIRGVPAVVVNARLSDRSFRRMRRLGPAARLLVRGLTRVLAASGTDGGRFIAFGMPAERVVVTGNLKLDVTLAEPAEGELARFREELGLGKGRVLLGASTWPGEERALLEAWRGLGGDWKLLLVPRHAERRGEIEAWCASEAAAGGWRYHFRSRGRAPGEVGVAVADTTGELSRLLALADLVFIGKTLPPHTEGQTPVEAAARGRAIVFGPGTANFRQIAEELAGCGGACPVADAEALCGAVSELARDEARRAALGEAAARWHRGNRGAAARTCDELARILADLK
jgi:3-deoxy-D-manno-octulosonic-acid transferase